MSALRVVFNLRFTLPFDKFPNIDRMPHIESPVFIIHGRRDEIVPFHHAEELFAASKNKYPPYYVEGAGHNNVEKFAADYLVKIRQFIQHIDEYVTERIKREGNNDEDEEENANHSHLNGTNKLIYN